jgi:hypothetical protein
MVVLTVRTMDQGQWQTGQMSVWIQGYNREYMIALMPPREIEVRKMKCLKSANLGTLIASLNEGTSNPAQGNAPHLPGLHYGYKRDRWVKDVRNYILVKRGDY